MSSFKIQRNEFCAIVRQFLDEFSLEDNRENQIKLANTLFAFLNSKVIHWDELWIAAPHFSKFLRTAINKATELISYPSSVPEEECPDLFTFVRIYAKMIGKYGSLLYPQEEALQDIKEQHLKEILTILTKKTPILPSLPKERYELRPRVCYHKYDPSEWVF